MAVEVYTDVERLGGIVDEWRALLGDSGYGNPFLVPEWQIAWARHFTAPGELRVATVRRAGELIAVAPFYRHHSCLGPLKVFTRVRQIGRGKSDVLTELPQILCHRDWHRKALRAVVSQLTDYDRRMDWLEVTLGPEQGWLEPEWLPAAPGERKWVTVHAGVVPTVVMPLPLSVEALDRQLKRNVKESIRRSVNRLKRAGVDWRFEVVAEPGAELQGALDRLVGLHAARARAVERPQHSDYFAAPEEIAFLQDAAQAMAPRDHVKVCSIVVGERAIASLLVLRANGGVFFSASGMDPDWWEFGPMTLLQRECLRDAVSSGDRVVNLSRGPNASKLRWAEELAIHHDFNVVSNRRRSRRSFALYAPYRALAEFRMRAGARRTPG